MSDTDMERRSNARFVHRANGSVLIGGLGLGMILHPTLAKPEVKLVTVVEQNADVIALIAPTLPRDKRLTIVNGDIYEWKPAKGTKYDTVYFDVWGNMSIDNLAEMATLHRREVCQLPHDGEVHAGGVEPPNAPF